MTLDQLPSAVALAIGSRSYTASAGLLATVPVRPGLEVWVRVPEGSDDVAVEVRTTTAAGWVRLGGTVTLDPDATTGWAAPGRAAYLAATLPAAVRSVHALAAQESELVHGGTPWSSTPTPLLGVVDL